MAARPLAADREAAGLAARAPQPPARGASQPRAATERRCVAAWSDVQARCWRGARQGPVASAGPSGSRTARRRSRQPAWPSDSHGLAPPSSAGAQPDVQRRLAPAAQAPGDRGRIGRRLQGADHRSRPRTSRGFVEGARTGLRGETQGPRAAGALGSRRPESDLGRGLYGVSGTGPAAPRRRSWRSTGPGCRAVAWSAGPAGSRSPWRGRRSRGCRCRSSACPEAWKRS
jgi:hypothetical protein